MEENIVGLHIPGAPMLEDRFTWATDLCPHPEYWTSTDGDSTEVEVSDLAYGLVRALQPSLCVETGSGFGQTSSCIAAALATNGHGRLVTIEPEPDRIQATREALASFSRVEIFEGRSLDWMPDEEIQFAWLDSFYELRIPEYRHYRPFMRPGTIVCFHDTAPEHGSHRIASGRDLRSELAHELSDELNFIHLPTPRGLTVAQVKA